MYRHSWIICAAVILLAPSPSVKAPDPGIIQPGDNNDQGRIDKKPIDSSPDPPSLVTRGWTTVKQTLVTNEAPYSYNCGTPPPDPCAYISVEQKDASRRVANYTCKSPYTLIGQQSLVCSVDGSWDRINSTEDWPSCQVDCGPIPFEPNAYVSVKGYGGYSKAPWVTYVCSDGYASAVSLSNAENVTCDPYTLEWDRPSLHCAAALKEEATAESTFEEYSGYLLDGNIATCLLFSSSGSAIITFDTTMEVYNITLQAQSNRDVFLNVTLKNSRVATENWLEPRVPSSEWTNGKTLPWMDRKTPLLGTTLNVTISFLERSTTFSLCEVEVIARPLLAACSPPPSPVYGQQLKADSSSERCDSEIGYCLHGTQVEYECQAGFIQTSGEAVIECGKDRSWSNLTLQCVYAPAVILLQDSPDKRKCEAVKAPTSIFSMDQQELHYAVINISVANSSDVRQGLRNFRVVFEYLMALDEYVVCEYYNLTIGTWLYLFDCPKRPVPTSVRLRFTNENSISDISICFIKAIVRKYDKDLECMQASPQDYRGHINYAYTGEPCDFWSSHHSSNETIRGESLESAGNFCRNRKHARSLPWCRVNETAKDCPVIMCDQACILPWSANGVEYVGQQDFEMETTMSWKCISWNETLQPDVCPVLQKSLFVDSNSDTDYCRNPDRRTTGPWCNVRPCLQGDCSVREMSCKIPTCPNTDQIESGTINVLNDTEKLWFLTTPMVECWLYTNGSMKRYAMPRVQPLSTETIDIILQNWCDVSAGKNFMATCHNSTNWYRLLLLCEINITSPVEWTSSIATSLLTQDISSPFSTEETIPTMDTLISSSTISSFISSQTQEFLSSYSLFTHSPELTQTVPNLGPTTVLQGTLGPYPSSTNEHFPTQTVTPLGQTITSRLGITLTPTVELKPTETVGNPDAKTTLQSEIKPSSSLSYKDVTTQTVPVSPNEITVQEISRSTTTDSKSTPTTTPATRRQTSTVQTGTTNPSSSPAYERKAHKNHCPCWCSSDKTSESLEESATKAAKLSQLLQVHKNNLSKVINGKISMNDSRASARVISSVFATVILIIFVSLIVLPDVISATVCMLHGSCCIVAARRSPADLKVMDSNLKEPNCVQK